MKKRSFGLLPFMLNNKDDLASNNKDGLASDNENGLTNDDK